MTSSNSLRSDGFLKKAGMLAAFSLLFLLSLGFASPARAAHVSCGQTITQSTALDSDVGPCPQDGIIVGADSITLDLNGHRVFGIAVPGTDQVGVHLTGRTAVKVQNGSVDSFNTGVGIEGGSANKVSAINAHDNIGNSTLSNFGDGIAISDSNNNNILKNTAVHNGPFDGIGLFGSSSGNMVANNTVTNNDIDSTPILNQDDGVRLEPGTTLNTVKHNTVTGSGLDGIAVFATATGNVVVDNVVKNNGFHDKSHRKGDGIRLFATANNSLVQSNSVFGNAANGIIVSSQSNQILTNTTGDNNQIPSVQNPNYDLRDTNPDCDANAWHGNTFGSGGAFPACTTAP